MTDFISFFAQNWPTKIRFLYVFVKYFCLKQFLMSKLLQNLAPRSQNMNKWENSN